MEPIKVKFRRLNGGRGRSKPDYAWLYLPVKYKMVDGVNKTYTGSGEVGRCWLETVPTSAQCLLPNEMRDVI